MASGKLRPVLISAAIVLVSLALALVIGEVLLAVLNLPRAGGTDAAAIRDRAAHQEPLWLPDPVLEHRARPGARREGKSAEFTHVVETRSLGTDEIGFRDEGIDGPVYLVATGDSMTWGHGVDSDQSWVELLEKEGGADCVNMGVSNMTAFTQEQHILRLHGLRLHPKVALMGRETSSATVGQTYVLVL